MANHFKETVTVISQEQIGTGIFSMWIKTDNIAKEAVPGQFISLYCNEGSRILPRPISICEIQGDTLRIVYRVVGKGTDEFSTYIKDDTIEVMGPLGNGFPLDRAAGKNILLVAGGIGIPPMVELAKQLSKTENVNIAAGYRDELFLTEELEKNGKLYIASEDGIHGTKGNVIDAMNAERLNPDVIFACGPTPMLKALKAYAADNSIEAWLSLEEKMACGIGACLACVCKSKEKDHHTNVHNKRICKDGPVFLAEEVEF